MMEYYFIEGGFENEKDMGFNLTVLMYIQAEGTFGKSKEVVKRKQQGRVKELKLLNTANQKNYSEKYINDNYG